jgi:hypothetical protein
VLKDRSTNTELFVINFQLLPSEEGKKAGLKDPEEMVKEVHGDDKKAGSDSDKGNAGGDDDELD